MSTYQRLAPAALVAAVALVIAACWGTSSPATTTASTPATTPASSPATTPTSEPSSSTAVQANVSYPYSPGGVTYTGVGGQVDTFSIPAGTYTLNQQASYDPANDPDDSGQCLVGAELDYLSGSGRTIPLGDNGAPVTAAVPIGSATAAPYPAGNYRLYVYPTTTCSWTFELWP